MLAHRLAAGGSGGAAAARRQRLQQRREPSAIHAERHGHAPLRRRGPPASASARPTATGAERTAQKIRPASCSGQGWRAAGPPGPAASTSPVVIAPESPRMATFVDHESPSAQKRENASCPSQPMASAEHDASPWAARNDQARPPHCASGDPSAPRMLAGNAGQGSRIALPRRERASRARPLLPLCATRKSRSATIHARRSAKSSQQWAAVG